jgi:methyltransferase (TIGR00027 family)
MRTGSPSLTALGVAIMRSRLDRPSTPEGDPGAEARLAESLGAPPVPPPGSPDAPAEPLPRDEFTVFLEARTAFVDDAVLRAIAGGVQQVVILGAGYDGRALRFRSPGVTFFEVDHPATQADKRARLEEIGASTEGIVFVTADFTEPGLAAALAAQGHDASAPSLVTCEGVLRYLPEEWFQELLRASAEVSAPGSELAATIVTRAPDVDDSARRARLEHEQMLADGGEAVLTVPERATAVEWLEDAGWSVDEVIDPADTADPTIPTPPGRLLVRAHV